MTFNDCVVHLYRWKTGTDTSTFHALLYTLIAKADGENLGKIRMGFRDEVQAYEDWRLSPSEKEFFQAFGIES